VSGLITISPTLIQKHVAESEILRRAFELLESDDEVQELIKMSNIMAVGRLRYNDHGIVHARIVSGAALELFDLLTERGVKPSTLRFGTARNVEEAKLIVLMAAYLHDIGNAVHRDNHELIGALISKDILDRLLPEIIPDIGRRKYLLRQEIMHAIYATEMHRKALTIEAGIVMVSDGTDMAEGRARIPYRLGKLDMHAVSAISIRKVLLGPGNGVPARIEVLMNDKAGLFQIEAVLKPKIGTSGLGDYLEVYAEVDGNKMRVFPD